MEKLSISSDLEGIDSLMSGEDESLGLGPGAGPGGGGGAEGGGSDDNAGEAVIISDVVLAFIHSWF